ncbi:MAG TPA: dihydrolipoamide acetyltransferase family protein [Chloroflexota bacterium]|nr:dihydrolipoamide acetyltransferase family protein [Chloroflexota bacterium]
MPHQVTMPMLGLTMEEGTITEWLKQPGDAVAKEEPLFVVETDKSAVEVGAPASGVLSQIIVQVGQTVPVSAPIAVIAQPGEAVEARASPAPAPPAAAAPAPAGAPSAPEPSASPAPAAAAPRAAGERQAVSPRARMVARELGIDVTSVTGTGPGGRVVERDVRAAAAAAPLAPAVAVPPERIVASPLARKLAEEHGVDLAQVSGSGPGGRITERDVTAFVDARAAAPAAPAPAEVSATLPAVAAATGAFEPLNRVRRITADRMAASARSVARVTLLMEVDMTEAVRFRTQLAPEFEKRYGARLAYDAMIAKACAIGLAEHPHVNAQWQDADIGQPAGLRLQPNVNVGIAVAAEAGLLVVVVRDADQKPLAQVNSDLMGMVAKSKQGGLGPDELSGSTFTITNLGGYGVEAFTPIVNPPESAILGIGRIAKRPAVVDGQIVPRDLMYLSLAFDHRVVDGAPAAQFLRRVKECLEAPYVLLA